MALNPDSNVPREDHPQAARDFDRQLIIDSPRRRLWMWVVAPLVVIVLGVAVIGLISPSKDMRWDDSRYSSEETSRVAVATGTGGTLDERETPLTGSLRTLLSSGDYDDLVGQRAEVIVEPGQAMNDVAFWVGDGEQSLLVVMGRDLRMKTQGLGARAGDPAFDADMPLAERAVVRGVVEEVPYAEARSSWGLTTRDERLLAERGVYLRAYDMMLQ